VSDSVVRFIVRPAVLSDAAAIDDLYNRLGYETSASFVAEPSTVEKRLAWIEAQERAGFPVFVAEETGETEETGRHEESATREEEAPVRAATMTPSGVTISPECESPRGERVDMYGEPVHSAAVTVPHRLAAASGGDQLVRDVADARLDDANAQTGGSLAGSRGGRILGFAAYGEFRANTGYRHTVENTIWVDPRAHRRGVGRALMERLVEAARERGVHAIVAVISAENEASIGFHHRLGFEDGGVLRQVGRKFGRWLDAAFLVRVLDGPDPND
jgi:phosphinothricin acetyltransferase